MSRTASFRSGPSDRDSSTVTHVQREASTMFSFLRRKISRPSTTARNNRNTFRPRLEALEDRWMLSAGALDPTFGSGGTVTTSFNAGANAGAIALQPDGKIV